MFVSALVSVYSMFVMCVMFVICDMWHVSYVTSVTTAALASLGLPPNEVHTARVLNFLCDLLVDKE